MPRIQEETLSSQIIFVDVIGIGLYGIANHREEIIEEVFTAMTENGQTLPEKGTSENLSLEGFDYNLIHRVNWPLFERGEPVLANGSAKLDKPFIFRAKENLWNSMDQHCKRLGVGKSEWVREAILRQLYEEQMYFLQKRG